MTQNADDSSKVYLFVKRALEGRIGPVSFLLVIGFFSSLVLLYISLQVYFFNVSNEIVASRLRLDYLRERNVQLVAQYNDLVSPAIILPRATELGMRAGSSEEVRRLALLKNGAAVDGEPAWAEARVEGIHSVSVTNDPRGR